MTRVSDICHWLSWQLGQMLPMSPGTGIAAAATGSRSGAGIFCIWGNARHFQKSVFLSNYVIRHLGRSQLWQVKKIAEFHFELDGARDKRKNPNLNTSSALCLRWLTGAWAGSHFPLPKISSIYFYLNGLGLQCLSRANGLKGILEV